MHWIHQSACSCGLITASALAMIAGLSASESESKGVDSAAELAFSLQFWPGEVEMSGVVLDRAAATALVAEIRRSIPDAEIWDVDLEVDARAPRLPPMEELAGLLLELALSTKEGRLRIDAESIVVSGITDSLVTHAALETRLNELTDNRLVEMRNEIQVIPGEEFNLPSAIRPKPALNPLPLEFRPVEVSDEIYGPPALPIRARPIEVAEAPESIGSEEQIQSSEEAESSLDDPEPKREPAPRGTVRFETNSFLIGFDQHDRIRELADSIGALSPTASRVTLRGYPDVAGNSTYQQWLALTRAKQVRQLLIDYGVPGEKISAEAAKTGSNRQVLIILPGR